ncbi:hypothetical protein AJ80_04900 [Polytolypa hystricis UAMH7299]|uniref:Mis6 domain-containing protein n=1 Tax=Polytolypa hystricis (strain UAMH7299) TaxID=1447883 RepID=A0A2B7Y8K3_POLH7|nr:hypothetical protein AJ80_04900 [Polytolypa hystricis UAMH7299]
MSSETSNGMMTFHSISWQFELLTFIAATRERSWGLEDAIIQLENVASVPAKQRHTNVADLAKVIAEKAYESGLPLVLLGRLIDIISKAKHLDQTTITTLIKNLYPAERVPPNIVVKVICCLGPSKSKPSPATQSLLLRWIILIYEDMQEPAYLSRLYSILFNYLDMISLRRSLSHLLSLITRRKHVKPFRIQALMELIRNIGPDERELTGLLRVFKSYYPDIIVGESNLPTRRATYFFKHPDPEWVEQMRRIQERAAISVRERAQTFQVVRRGGVKRSRIEVVIPEVQTSRVKQNFTSLEELRNVRDFVQKLDKIELPNQIVSSLSDPLAQKYLLLVQNEGATKRLESWLDSFLEDELDRIREGGDEDEGGEHLGYVLQTAAGFVRYTKELPNALDKFIRMFLSQWNGHDYRGSILALLEYIPVSRYDELFQSYFMPLESAVLDETPQSKISILRYYSSLIRRWGTIVRSESSASAAVSNPLSQIILRAELLALTILESPPAIHGTVGSTEQQPEISRCLSVLEFYINLADLYNHAPNNANIRLTVPFPQTVYLLAFIPALDNISLLSSVLATYKAAFEASLSSTSLNDPASPEPLYPTATVAQFNGYVMDICNLIWRNRGLNSEDPNAMGCLIPAETINVLAEYLQELNTGPANSHDNEKHKYQVSTVFSLSQNVALSGISTACFKEIEDETAAKGEEVSVRMMQPVTQKALAALDRSGGVRINWQEYRLKLLDWLDERGAVGIGDLMRSTMKALRRT